jgi:two-component system, cell cycle response regulator
MDVSLPAEPVISGDERLAVDPLTGLRSEHLFRLSFPQEFARAREREINGALLVIKLDNIIAINAMHGRAGGDDALRAMAQLLQSCRAAPERLSHVVFKMSGPVFGYFVPACAAAASRAIAEEMLLRASQSSLYIGRLELSIGIVNLAEFFLDDGTREQTALLVEKTALYRLAVAERKGGSTVCDTSDIALSAASTNPVILLVEPEPSSLELLTGALEAAEFVVHVCTDGESAMEFIQTTPPHLIICEVMTPRLNGFAIRERLRANALWNAIPFVLVSHKKGEDLIRKAADVGVLHYLRKPLSVAEVVGLVTNITRTRL